MDLLKVTELSKTFGGLKAVQKVDFAAEAGKITSIIGPNGAGKTTVFNMLSGFYIPDCGSILLDGEEIAGLKTHHFIRKGIVRTFQNIRLFSELTVLDNVLIGIQDKISYNLWDAIIKTKKRDEQEKESTFQAERVLHKVGLVDKRDEIAKNLPYGQQRRLEIARAIVSSPRLILLDEPAAGMNPQETLELNGLIKTLPKEGITVLLIEHDMKLVMEISDHIVVLDHGVKLTEGDPGEVRKDARVIQAYLGKGAGADVTH